MRRIAIVGAGQSGLQLGMGLLSKGYEVTIYSNRTAEDLKTGRVLSSQCMFHTALENERDLGICAWDDSCPPVEGIGFVLAAPQGKQAFSWAARLDHPGQSVDQRVKIPLWMKMFEERGGRIVYEEADMATLEKLARENELVLVASGKGDIGKLFERDAEKSEFDRPMRSLALTYVKNLTPRPEFSAVTFNVAPGVGEYFVFPALTTSGPCEIMVFEGIPGGPMDCWKDVTSPAQHMERSVEILKDWFPWEAERAVHAELTDDNGILAGRFPPTIRKPMAKLPSGAVVMGLADAVALNDPITGQGANNASKCARIYMDRIIANGGKPFDAAWMQGTFEAYWAYAKYVVNWTNRMLLPPEQHVVGVLQAASNNPALARRLANGFDDPRDFSPWWFDATAAQALLAS
jgi:hypothetical protein